MSVKFDPKINLTTFQNIQEKAKRVTEQLESELKKIITDKIEIPKSPIDNQAVARAIVKKLFAF